MKAKFKFKNKTKMKHIKKNLLFPDIIVSMKNASWLFRDATFFRERIYKLKGN